MERRRRWSGHLSPTSEIALWAFAFGALVAVIIGIVWYQAGVDNLSKTALFALVGVSTATIAALLARIGALAASDASFRETVESAPDALFIVNPDGRIALINSEAEHLFGYQRSELIGQPIEILVPHEARQRHRAFRANFSQSASRRAMGSGLELLGLRKDGTTLPIDVSLSPVRQRGQMMVLAAIRDVTERRHIERQLAEHAAELQRSNSELEMFAYVASHDLQEPLRMVASYLELLDRRYRDRLDDDAREFIGFAVDGATRMKQLINDLLGYSRAGSAPLKLETVDTEALVAAVVETLSMQI